MDEELIPHLFLGAVLWTYHSLFIHSSMEGHLGCLWIWAPSLQHICKNPHFQVNSRSEVLEGHIFILREEGATIQPSSPSFPRTN